MQQERKIEFLSAEHNSPIVFPKMTEQENSVQYLQYSKGQNLQIQELHQILNELRTDNLARLTEHQNQSEMRLGQLKKMFLMIKEKFNQGIDEIIQIIENGRNQIAANIQKDLDQLSKANESMKMGQIDQYIKELKKKSQTYNQVHDQKIRMQTIEQYLKLVKFLNKQIKLEFVQNQLDNVKISEINIGILSTHPMQLGQYERIFQQNGIYSCKIMAMDKDEKILVNGQGVSIQIWSFNDDGSLTLKYSLEGHTDTISCLCFSKISQWFISGSFEKTLRIWKEEPNGKWNQFQVLKGHQHWVNDIILNNEEDQLISCSWDQMIKVWMKKTEGDKWECKQTLTEHKKQVQFLSLNPDCNILASCGSDRLIIWERGNDKLWKQKQVVDDPKNDKYVRICFIDANELIAQTENQGRLYRLISNKQGQFIVKSELKILNEIEEQDLYAFPIVYNKQLQMVIFRQSNTSTCILMKQADGEFVIHQVLKGNYQARYLSNNARYLILGDYHHHNIEVWKLK